MSLHRAAAERQSIGGCVGCYTCHFIDWKVNCGQRESTGWRTYHPRLQRKRLFTAQPTIRPSVGRLPANPERLSAAAKRYSSFRCQYELSAVGFSRRSVRSTGRQVVIHLQYSLTENIDPLTRWNSLVFNFTSSRCWLIRSGLQYPEF